MKPTKTTVSRCPVCGANNRRREQKLIDMMFEIAVRGQVLRFASRNEAADYVASQLRAIGFDTRPLGISWGVLL